MPSTTCRTSSAKVASGETVSRSGSTFITMPGTRSATEPMRPIIGRPSTTSDWAVAREV